MSANRNTILSFQGLRALAFLGIFLYHFGIAGLSQTAAWSVSFFFMISGYLSGYAWRCGNRPACSAKNCVSYMTRRIRKLYVLHLIMLILSIPVSGAPASLLADGMGKLPFWVIVFIMNVTLTKSFYPAYYFGFNGVSWFLSSYAVLCLLTPLLLWLIPRFIKGIKLSKCILFTAVLTLISFGYCYIIGRSPVNVEYWIYIFPLARLAEYAAGIAAGMCYDKVPRKCLPPMQLLSCILILLFSFVLDLPEWIFFTVIWIIPNVILLWSFHNTDNLLTNLVGNRLLVFLGNHSANMFLIHQIFISYGFLWIGTPDSLTKEFLTAVLFYLITLGLSAGYQTLSQKYIHK